MLSKGGVIMDYTTKHFISKLAEDLDDNKLLTIANQLREHCIANKGDDTYL